MDESIILSPCTKYMLYFEKGSIITFAISIIILFNINVYILFENARVLPLYSYYFMNERLVLNYYLTSVYLLPVTIPESQCLPGYFKRDFASIENFKGVPVNDITNITKIQDPLSNTFGLLDLIKLKRTYYNFDITDTRSGFPDFPLINKYSLNNWKGTNFCTKRLYFDEYYQGLKMVNVTTQCREKFGNSSDDCGTYGVPEYGSRVNDNSKYFRICVLRDLVFIDEELTENLHSTTDPIYIGMDACPLQNFDFDYRVNFNYDSRDVNSWAYDSSSMTMKNNALLKETGNYNLTKMDFWLDPLQNPMPLITLFDLAYFDNNQAYPKPNETYVFGIDDDATFNTGQKYGLTDLMAVDLDYYFFFNIFNDTFFSESVYDPSTKTYSYEPDFAVKSDEKNFIVPEKTSSINYKVTLNKKFVPVFSLKCFEGVFQDNPDFIKFLTNLNIKFIDEYVLSSISLCLMLGLLAYYSEFYIRFYIINRLFENNINTYDYNSEKYTKYTHKIWELSLLFISVYYQIFNISKIETGITTADLLLKNDCFLLNNPPENADPDEYKDHANIQFTYYIEFLSNLNVIMKGYLAILIIIFAMMIMVTISYCFVTYTEDDVVLNTEERMINDLVAKNGDKGKVKEKNK